MNTAVKNLSPLKQKRIKKIRLTEETKDQSRLFNYQSLDKDQLLAELVGLKKESKEEDNESSGGSDSEPSEGRISDEEMAKFIPMKIKKKKTGKRKSLMTKITVKQEPKPISPSPIRKLPPKKASNYKT